MPRLALLVVFTVLACKDRVDKPPPARTVAVSADAAPPAELEPLQVVVERIRAKKKLPALAAVAWRDGKLVDAAVAGLRKAGDPAHPVTIEDRWHLGSNTKAMTALLIGIHVDRGVLRWDDTLAKLFAGERIAPGYAKVTLDQLIRHTGGAPAQPPEALWRRLWTDGTAPDARTKLVREVLAAEPAQPPGTFTYSNTGYMIAGVALERATKRRWEDLMRADVFTPLGMASCGFGAPGSADAVDQPWGHDASGAAIAPGPQADNPPGLGPAGTVHCTLADYGRFLAVHAGTGPALVKPETLAHLHDPRGARYAGGWIVLKGGRGPVLVHNGSNTMWFVSALVSPATRTVLVLASNQGEPLEDTLFETMVVRYAPNR